MTTRVRRPSALVVALGLWLLCLLGWVAALALTAYRGDLGCELLPGTSIYGRAEWGWLPPGTTCTYLTGGLVVEEGPTGADLAVPVLLLLWPATVLLVARARR